MAAFAQNSLPQVPRSENGPLALPYAAPPSGAPSLDVDLGLPPAAVRAALGTAPGREAKFSAAARVRASEFAAQGVEFVGSNSLGLGGLLSLAGMTAAFGALSGQSLWQGLAAAGIVALGGMLMGRGTVLCRAAAKAIRMRTTGDSLPPRHF